MPGPLAIVATAALTFLIGERLRDYWHGFFAGLIYLSLCGTFLLGRIIMPEPLFAAFVAGAVFSATQQFVSPESFGLFESIIVLAMVVLGGMGNIPGVILGAILLTLLPEVLRYTMEPLQHALFGRVILDAETIRLLVFGVALVAIMLFRPAGIWPSAVRKRELEVKGGAA